MKEEEIENEVIQADTFSRKVRQAIVELDIALETIPAPQVTQSNRPAPHTPAASSGSKCGQSYV